jgi:hypothetical protein
MDPKLKIILIISIILLFLAIYFLLYKTKEGYYSSYSQNSEVDDVVTQNGNSYITDLTTIYNPDGNTYVTGNSYIDNLHGNYLLDGNSFITSGNTIDNTIGNTNVNYRYNKDNLDVTYHPDATSILNNSINYTLLSDTIISHDASGNQILIPKNIEGPAIYYEPGSFKFGASTYVPNYADSIYLSKITGEANTGKYYDTASILGGQCEYYKNSPIKLEEVCNATRTDKCSSMSCCVLLGGSKCVAGNESGPIMKSNFADIYVKNRDFYYYNGKCYGNCPN